MGVGEPKAAIFRVPELNHTQTALDSFPTTGALGERSIGAPFPGFGGIPLQQGLVPTGPAGPKPLICCYHFLS